jgi:HSP20 family molecular chaperone IbpA
MGHSLFNGGWGSGWWMWGQPFVLLLTLILFGALAVAFWHTAKNKTSLDDVREPRVIIRDENLESVIVAELPGVREDEIKVDVEEGFIVSLETTGALKYATTVPLSETVNAASLRKTYQNGLLELRLQKA